LFQLLPKFLAVAVAEAASSGEISLIQASVCAAAAYADISDHERRNLMRRSPPRR
jgi:hypothetical protein